MINSLQVPVEMGSRVAQAALARKHRDVGCRQGGLSAENMGRKGNIDGADIHSYVSQYSLTCSQQGGEEEVRKGAGSSIH